MRELHCNEETSNTSKGAAHLGSGVYGIRSTNTSRLADYSKSKGQNVLQPTDGMVLFVRSIIPRLLAALATSPSRGDVAWTAGIGAVHATLSFGFARWSRFITPRYAKLGPWGLIGVVVKTLITPSIIEEAIFRGALLPHPAVDEAMTWTASLGMTAFASNLLFVIYHLSPWHRPKKVALCVSMPFQ